MIITNIKDWMTATYVSSMEYCGQDLSNKNLISQLNAEQLKNVKCVEWLYILKPRLVCVDGFNMSVQGGRYNYSEPKENVEIYESMEVGYSSSDEPELSGDDGVTGYVSIEDLQKIINRHGGIDVEKSLVGLNYSNCSKYRRDKKLERILKMN